MRSKKWDVNNPEIRQMVEQVKWEIAEEQGIQFPRDGYCGHIVSKDLGKIGSLLQQRIPLLLEWKQQQAKTHQQAPKKPPASKRGKQK